MTAERQAVSCATADNWVVPLESYYNGRPWNHTLRETYELFWQINFAWLVVLDWYRYEVRSAYGDFYMHEVHRASRILAFHLHQRSTRTLTLNDLRRLDPRAPYIGRNAFHARASRFNAMFKQVPKRDRPFMYCEAHESDGSLVPGYRMSPRGKWLMVMGVNPSSQLRNEDVDWSVFLVDPQKKKPKHKQ